MLASSLTGPDHPVWMGQAAKPVLELFSHQQVPLLERMSREATWLLKKAM